MKAQGGGAGDHRSRSGKHIGGAHRGLAGSGGKGKAVSSDGGTKAPKHGKMHGGGHKPAMR
jgi:hypothetical protein